MLKHIVMWKLDRRGKTGAEVRENARAMKARLESLPALIPEIAAFEVGIDVVQSESSYDVVLVSAFESLGHLERYQKHAAHLEVAAFIKSVVLERGVVDYAG